MPLKPLQEMETIRVVVNSGGGFGHQRAAITLMQKLREMGFTGIFDIQCQCGSVERRLKSMMPDLESLPLAEDQTRTLPSLERVRLSVLPPRHSGAQWSLPLADLAVCAADDVISPQQTKNAELFNAPAYIGLEPTDWKQGRCYVVENGVLTLLPDARTMRLSSRGACVPVELSSVRLTETEKKVLETPSCPKVNSQLVYGLSEEVAGGGQSARDGVAAAMRSLIQAHTTWDRSIDKPVLILTPEIIVLDRSFKNSLHWAASRNIFFVDFRTGPMDMEQYKPNQVVIAYTGPLQQAVFDHLLLRATHFPPVIEGCNARELCESAGRPFIHAFDGRLATYPAVLSGKQALHAAASVCLQRGGDKGIPALQQYMLEALMQNEELLAYHAERRKAFLSRPDACERAFVSLGITYPPEISVIGQTLLAAQAKDLGALSADVPALVRQQVQHINGVLRHKIMLTEGSFIETLQRTWDSLSRNPSLDKALENCEALKTALQKLGVRISSTAACEEGCTHPTRATPSKHCSLLIEEEYMPPPSKQVPSLRGFPPASVER